MWKIIIVKSYLCFVLISAKYLFPEYTEIYSHPHNLNKSYFGFTVQLQSTNGNNRLIVGAPRSNDEKHESLREPGAVFSCSLNGNKCEQYEFDSGNDEEFIRGKNNSCLGHSLDVNSDGRLVACAPRWINYKMSQKTPLRMTGMCYYLKDSSNIQPTNTENLMPLNNTDLEFDGLAYNYIFGATGLSSHLIENSERVIMTAVGVYNWTGSIIQHDDTDWIVIPKKVKKLESYSYFGYSLTTGHFNSSDLSKFFYVSGSPRSDNLTGMVHIYEPLISHESFLKRFDFPGQKFGEYFGASLAVADLNGDGLDDLIIGAPMHSNEKYEIGRMYVYITQKYESSIKVRKINDPFLGEREKGRFGTAISSLGDINKDGCNDVAVSSPYDNQGVVYIFLGQNNINKVLILDQTIRASEHFPHMRGFGYSLSRGTDIDENFSNDLAIGSYLSGHAVVIKSRPIIKIAQDLYSNLKIIDIKNNNFNIIYCLNYTTNDIPQLLTIKTIFTSDNPQIVFNSKKVYTEEKTYRKNNTTCTTINVDIYTGLEKDVIIHTRYEIITEKTGTFCKECPIDATIEKNAKLTIPFGSGCGDDNECQPNLKLSAYFSIFGQKSESLILGSTKTVDIFAKIENVGENSFGTKLAMRVDPSSLDVINFDTKCRSTSRNVDCDYSTLKANNKIESLFTLNVEKLTIKDKIFSVIIDVASSSKDADLTDNNINIILPITTDVKYQIRMNSEPEQLTLHSNVSTVKVVHTYKIESVGKTSLDDFDVIILIPYEYNNKIIADNIDISVCENTDDNFKETNPELKEISENEATDSIVNLNCSSTHTNNLKCRKYICKIKNEESRKLEKGEIKIDFDLDVSVFYEGGSSVYLVTSVETNSEYFKLMSYAKTSLIAVIRAQNIAMYAIISVIVGILLLLIILLILYKCKFFKKKTLPIPEEELILSQEQEDKEDPIVHKDEEVKVEINNERLEDKDFTKMEEEEK